MGTQGPTIADQTQEHRVQTFWEASELSGEESIREEKIVKLAFLQIPVASFPRGLGIGLEIVTWCQDTSQERSMLSHTHSIRTKLTLLSAHPHCY